MGIESQDLSKLVNNRLASRTYKEFLLADLFYMGYYFSDPECALSVESSDLIKLDSSNLQPLSYNSLKRQTKKKRNYLLSRPYTVNGNQDVIEFFKGELAVLKETVDELYKKGEVWWEFEPDSKSPIKFKISVRKAQSIVPEYTNEENTEYDAVGYLWNKIEGDKTLKYIDFIDKTGRHRYSITDKYESKEELGHAVNSESKQVLFKSLPFICLKCDGLYQQLNILSRMYSERYVQANTLLEDNADPVAIIKNASDTDAAILKDEIRDNRLVKVEGDGEFSYASKTLDYSSIESFMKVAKSDIADICGTVSREQELSYVTSGRALDRLYVDMDADAADMGEILRQSIRSFLSFIDLEKGTKYLDKFEIIFNTDKPTDEQQIITNINSSKDLLSTRTLLKQHPWVEDVDEEIKAKEKEDKEKTPPQNPNDNGNGGDGNNIPPEPAEEVNDE